MKRLDEGFIGMLALGLILVFVFLVVGAVSLTLLVGYGVAGAARACSYRDLSPRERGILLGAGFCLVAGGLTAFWIPVFPGYSVVNLWSLLATSCAALILVGFFAFIPFLALILMMISRRELRFYQKIGGWLGLGGLCWIVCLAMLGLANAGFGFWHRKDLREIQAVCREFQSSLDSGNYA